MIKENDILVCIDDSETYYGKNPSNLTLNKNYKCLEINYIKNDMFVEVKNDNGVEQFFSAKRFVNIIELRKRKLKKLNKLNKKL